MSRDYLDFLEDILSSINETFEFTAGMTFETFAQDRKTSNAVVRSLEVMGEAAKHVPAKLRVLAPNVPWKYMAGMRDKLIHEYFGVDLAIVWGVVQDELPAVRPEIQRLMDRMDE